jgi:hypothetical protein
LVQVFVFSNLLVNLSDSVFSMACNKLGMALYTAAPASKNEDDEVCSSVLQKEKKNWYKCASRPAHAVQSTLHASPLCIATSIGCAKVDSVDFASSGSTACFVPCLRSANGGLPNKAIAKNQFRSAVLATSVRSRSLQASLTALAGVSTVVLR